MTITYAKGVRVEGLLLSSEGDAFRVAIAGDDDVRVFTRSGGVWRAEDGEVVNIAFAWQKSETNPPPEESHFICSKELGRQLISNLMNGAEVKGSGPSPLYVFTGDRQRVHITVFRHAERKAS